VPIEDADPDASARRGHAVALHEDAEYRRAVDERLRRMLIDEGIAGDVEVLTVGGDLRARAEAVLAQIARARR
jgi:hypothetical protein